VACKIQVGDYSKTSSDQWIKVPNLSKDNKENLNTKWYKQQRLGKLPKSQYKTLWWNKDVFELKSIERKRGIYSRQACEVEIVLDKDSIPDSTKVDLQIGARFYTNNEARTFRAVPQEPKFTWFRSQMTYTPALEVPATYESGTEKIAAQPVQEKVIDLSSAFAARIAAAGLSAPSGALEVSAPSSRLSVSTAAPSIKAGISAKQTVQQGYKTYQPINESDWWWWYLALDIPDALLKTNEILYQYVTVTDGSKYYAMGCSMKIGQANSYAIDYYKLTSSS